MKERDKKSDDYYFVVQSAQKMIAGLDFVS